MRKTVHKLIRYRSGEINVVADLNASIATGGTASSSHAESYSRIVQRRGRSETESQAAETTEKEVKDGKKS
jgi:hypothetical protein